MKSFNQLLRVSGGGVEKGGKFKDLFDAPDDETANKIAQSHQMKVEQVNTKKVEIDLEKLIYVKDGLNEFKAKSYLENTKKIVPNGTEINAKELYGNYEMIKEYWFIPPQLFEDMWGNYWRMKSNVS